jgi:pre-rRNA-processing protein TSR1
MLAFRTSPWDSKENLPLDYARIFKFANFSRTKQLALAEMTADYTEEKSNQVAMPGAYVTLYVSNVPAHMLNGQHVDLPFIVNGLLKNEQKFSLMNVVLRKYSQCTTPIKNKQTLIFHVGYRRFEINPVFSQHSNGDKFKVVHLHKRDLHCLDGTIHARWRAICCELLRSGHLFPLSSVGLPTR